MHTNSASTETSLCKGLRLNDALGLTGQLDHETNTALGDDVMTQQGMTRFIQLGSENTLSNVAQTQS